MQLIVTGDSSHTILNTELNETYHSTHGAIQESNHIFIESGLRPFLSRPGDIQLLEIGFGTGLNAMLTQLEAETIGKNIVYSAIEAYPLEQETWAQLNYPQLLCQVDYTGIFDKIHLAAWDKCEKLSNFFCLHKIHIKLEDWSCGAGMFDLVYFDAFSPAVQPELWTAEIFAKIYTGMKQDAVLVTYSVKGDVVRALKTAGFLVEKLPGPPGKRQITRALKSA